MYSNTHNSGFQAGSLLGALGVAPLLALRQGGVSVELVTRGAGYGALGGLGLSGAWWASFCCECEQERRFLYGSL